MSVLPRSHHHITQHDRGQPHPLQRRLRPLPGENLLTLAFHSNVVTGNPSAIQKNRMPKARDRAFRGHGQMLPRQHQLCPRWADLARCGEFFQEQQRLQNHPRQVLVALRWVGPGLNKIIFWRLFSHQVWLVTRPPPASTGPTATARGAATCSRAAVSPRVTRPTRAAPTCAPQKHRADLIDVDNGTLYI